MMNAHPRDMPTTFIPDAENTRQLRDAFGTFTTGVTVVTCMSDKGPLAMTANSFTSISLDPALVMWAIGSASRRCAAFTDAAHFAIHILADTQADLCTIFAKDGLALKDHQSGTTDEGIPVLSDCLARLDCARHAVHTAGDHEMILGQVLRGTISEGAPLAFFGGKLAKLAAQ